MKFRSQILSVAAMFGLLLSFGVTSSVHAGGMIAAPGDLIRGTSFSAVYYMGEDGFRYVFPNEKTYGTWYTNPDTGALDFSTVKTLSDADLATIQMGGNVTYHPGLRMVKINSDPKTYLVTHGGVLRWVSTEADAVAMYGTDWNTKIDDVADGFFTNYTVGDVVDLSSDTSSGSLVASREFGGTSSISEDKELTDYATLLIENMMYNGVMDGDGTLEIQAGQTVRFFNIDDVKHTATADDNSWGTGTIQPDGSFVRRFSTPGTYTFHCSYHPEMTGRIIVDEATTM
jgi:hypothetical protein